MRRSEGDKKGRQIVATGVAIAGLLLAACGDGGGGFAAPGGGMGGTVSGTATKGPVASATVRAFGVTGGDRGAQLATTRTDADGRFTMNVGTYSGPLLVEMRGGSYTDEATNATMTMGDEVMTVAVPSFDADSTTTIQVTPLTSMAQAMARGMAGGMTAANVSAANAAMASYFASGDIVHTPPMDPLVPGSGAGASQDARNYGMSIAAMSQFAKTIGMTTSSMMVTAMTNDASDGVMNGMMGTTPVEMRGMGGMMGGTAMMPTTGGTSGLAQAMAEFVGSSMNRSGISITAMQPLIDKLSASSGALR